MASSEIQAQALAVTALLPGVMRRLFAIDSDDPAADLPIAQLRLCAVLQDGSRPMSVVSSELGISLSATCQLVGRLEKVGMVERLAESDDRRVKCLQLTPHGHETMRARRERRLRRAEQALAHLTSSERAHVISALKTLLDASSTALNITGPTSPVAKEG